MTENAPLSRKPAGLPAITMGKGKSTRGRKSILIDRNITRRLRDALAAGNTYDNACRMAGIGRTTFYRWMDESKSAPVGHPLREFRDTIKRASAIAEHFHVMVIQKAAERHWQAAAWWLERRYPRQYGRRKAVAVGVDPDAPSVLAAQSSKKPLTAEGALGAILKRRAPHLIGALESPL